MAKIGKSDVANAILNQLKDPFNPALVKYTKLGGNKVVAYVDARDVMKRLDTIMGTENWQDKYIRTDGGFICELSLRIEDEWITKSNGANDTKIAPQKGGISGAFKRAAVNWGVGRYFYYFDPLQWTRNNVSDWPNIFKPGAPGDWEEIAERDYGLLGGMDEEYGEFGQDVISNLDKIRSISNNDELFKFFSSLDQGQQTALLTEFNNRSSELSAAEIKAEIEADRAKNDSNKA